MTLSLFDMVVLAVLVLILLPVALTPAGWMFGVALAAIWLTVTYGGRYAAKLHLWKSEGERGRVSEVRKQSKRGDS